MNESAQAATNWNRRAWNRWRRARWIDGNGPFALLAHCEVLTVTLHETLEEAEKDKAAIKRTGCGARCLNAHEIVDMRERKTAADAESLYLITLDL
jgi:hypothetical protein